MSNQLLVTWAEMKSFADSRGVSLQWVDLNGVYYIVGIDGAFSLSTKIIKESPASADQSDFETNYKDDGNRSPITSTKNSPSKFKTSLRLQGDSWFCPANQQTTHFMSLGTDYEIRGAEFQMINGKFGDTVELWVTDKDGIAYPAGTRLTKYVPKFCVYEHEPNTTALIVDLVDEDTSDLVPSFLYLEFLYTNSQPAGNADVKFIVNFWMYERS